jgi:hypothetical protein
VQENNTTNGGTLAGQPALTGIRENWTRELVEIPSSFYTSNAIRFRFEFSSDNDGSNFEEERDDGFYIDDFEIVKSTSPLITLPAHFTSFTGALMPDGTIRLDWIAQTDELHDHFEVEKSVDGIRFYYIGRGEGSSPYWKTDPSPETGNNYYRIKQVDKDGKSSYSNIINIVYKPISANLTVFPNPVKDILQLKISLPVTNQYNLLLTDLNGKKIYAAQIHAGPTAGDTIIDMNGYAPGVYILTVRSRKNETVLMQKIVKL